jgi:hypothetical protein
MPGEFSNGEPIGGLDFAAGRLSAVAVEKPTGRLPFDRPPRLCGSIRPMAGNLPPPRIQREMQLAQDARQHDQEGRARVCARRAAGWALEPQWRTAHPGRRPPGAYKLLSWSAGEPRIPAMVRQASQRLTVRVSADYRLPHEQDPLDDASIIIDWAIDHSS